MRQFKISYMVCHFQPNLYYFIIKQNNIHVLQQHYHGYRTSSATQNKLDLLPMIIFDDIFRKVNTLQTHDHSVWADFQ